MLSHATPMPTRPPPLLSLCAFWGTSAAHCGCHAHVNTPHAALVSPFRVSAHFLMPRHAHASTPHAILASASPIFAVFPPSAVFFFRRVVFPHRSEAISSERAPKGGEENLILERAIWQSLRREEEKRKMTKRRHLGWDEMRHDS